MKSNLILVCIFSLFSCTSLLGQNRETDTLSNQNSNYFFKLYEKAETKKEKIKYIEWFIKKAKIENEENKILSGYYIMSLLYDTPKALIYADSAINRSKKNPTPYFPMVVHLRKGKYYRKKYSYQKAIDNFLIANRYARKNNLEKFIIISNFSIGTIKRKIKDYEGAIELLKENYYFAKRSNNQINTLRSLIEISNIYTEYEKTDSVPKYVELGRGLALKLKDTTRYYHFFINEGINEYHKKKYNASIKSLKEASSHYQNKKNTRYLLYPYYYIAKSYDSLKKTSKALEYYKKSDSIFQLQKSFSPFMRDTYETLINHYKKENNLEQQLFFINRLLKFDSIVNQNEIYLNKKIYKEYDIPKLEAEKETILQQLKVEKNHSSYVIYITFVVVLFLGTLLYYQFKKRRVYKKRFEELLRDNAKNLSTKVKESKENKIEIPEPIVNEVMESLDKFESEKQYTSNKITLAKLAKEINTNTQYLSKIVNHYKGKTFSNYLNDLRINYITDKLKKDSLLQKFTIKAISEEAGFNNPESFSKAFYKVNGIKPSYFLKELEKM